LDENPDEVFGAVYSQLGIKLPAPVARDPQVWLTLDQLKREACDQKSIGDLAALLDKLGYRREAAQGQYNFVKRCGAPLLALHRSIDALLKLSDFPMALEVAEEFVRRAPTNADAYYLRAVAFDGVGDYRRALVDFADAVELFKNKSEISSRVFLRMANVYAKLGRHCEAVSPILTWMALDPVRRDNTQTQKIIADCELQGHCATSKENQRQRYALRGSSRVVLANGEINGVRGTFIIDTGASYVSVKSAFAERAKISTAGASGNDAVDCQRARQRQAYACRCGRTRQVAGGECAGGRAERRRQFLRPRRRRAARHELPVAFRFANVGWISRDQNARQEVIIGLPVTPCACASPPPPRARCRWRRNRA
jgi:aspartyl protease family protein